MRIITPRRLNELVALLPRSRSAVEHWVKAAEPVIWSNLAETRQTFPHADEVVARSGRTLTVFNLGGNKFRLVTSIHYSGRRVYIRELLTHADYDKGKWKDRS